MRSKTQEGSAEHGGGGRTPRKGNWVSKGIDMAKAVFTGKIWNARNKVEGIPSVAAMRTLARVVVPESRDRWMSPGLEWITPKYIEAVLTGTLMGESPEAEHALYDLMLRTWPRLGTNVMQFKNALSGLDWNVQYTGDKDWLKQLVVRMRDGMKGDYRDGGSGWRGTLLGLADGWFTGVSVREIDWERRGGVGLVNAILPRQTRRVAPRWYGWEVESGRFGMRLPSAGENAPLGEIEKNKFLVAMNNTSFGHASGGALLRSLAWWWCAANLGAEWLLNYAQLFGVPIRVANYDPADTDVVDILEDMLKNMGSSAYAVIPAGASLDIKEAAKGGTDNPQSYVLELADKMCDLLILGQTLTSEVGKAGSKAAADVHYQVRADIISEAGAWLAEIINEQLIPSVVELNVGDMGEDAALPWFSVGTKVNIHQQTWVELLSSLLEAGVPVQKEFLHEKTGTPMPSEGEEVYTKQDGIDAGFSGMVAKGYALDAALAKMPPHAREYVTGMLTDARSE